MGTDEDEWIPIVIKVQLSPRGYKKNDDGTVSYGSFIVNGSFEDIERAVLDAENGKGSHKSGRGRKSGSGKIPPSHIVGMVEEAIENKSAKNKQDAFHEFLNKDENCRYDSDTAKKIYYEFKKQMIKVEIDSLS